MSRNHSKRSLRLILTGALSFALFFNCAHQKVQTKVSQFRFVFNQQSYRILSVNSAEDGHSYNEIVGEKLLARDLDQDGILDSILLGDVTLQEAQAAYEHGLQNATTRTKMPVDQHVNRMEYETDNMLFELRSFQHANAEPFNEFIITDYQHRVFAQLTVVIDENADGKVDQIVKGSMPLSEAQVYYEKVIQYGLARGQLMRTNQTLRVRQE